MQVQTKFGDKSCTVDYEFGDSLEKSVEMFGEKVVYDRFIASAKIALQAYMSRLLKKEGKEALTEAQIKKLVETEFNLEGRKPTKSKAEKASELFSAMSPEEQEAFKALLAGD